MKILRREIKADIRKQHDLYVNNLVGDVKANPKDFYRYINSQKKDAQGIPPLKKRNGGGVAQSESEKAAEFNGQFTDVFTKSEYSQVPLLDRSAPFMENIVVTKEGVTKLLKGLNPSKVLAPDELHPRVLKELATELGCIFAHLSQQSIDSGDIPKEWTLANISLLFKKGDRSLACNYRPVSLTCAPCKLLEHIVCSNIMAHLDEHKLLSISKFNVGLKSLLHQGLSEPEFYGDLVYKFKKIRGMTDFSDQFRKIIMRYKCVGYNLNVMRQSACLVINPITVDSYAALFNCTPVDRASDSMMAPT